MKDIKIFISYSRMDKDKVMVINKCLIDVGYKVWLDNKISGGSIWWNSILDEIEQNNVFIYAISKYSIESYACNEEFNYAHNLNKLILPIILDENLPIETLDPKISELQIIPITFNKKNDLTYSSITGLWKGICSLNLDKIVQPVEAVKRPDMPIEDVDRIGYEIINSNLISQSRQLEITTELEKLTKKEQFKSKALENLVRLSQREEILFAKVKEKIDNIIGGNTIPKPDIEQIKQGKWKLFDICGKTLIRIVQHIEELLDEEKFEISRIAIEGGGIGIRARKTNWINILSGSSSSIEFAFMQWQDQLYYKSGPSNKVWQDITAVTIFTVATGGSGILIAFFGLLNYRKIRKKIENELKVYLES